MQEARNDGTALKNAEKNSKLESEKKKKTSGEDLVSRALGTRSPSDDEYDMSSAKKKRRMVPSMDPRAGITSFGEALRESDLARCRA